MPIDSAEKRPYYVLIETNNALEGKTMNLINQPATSEEFETFLSANKIDSKGREIGYIVGLSDNGTDFYVWVQNARRIKAGDWFEFGVRQRSKRFGSQEEATRYGHRVAKERIAKLNA